MNKLTVKLLQLLYQHRDDYLSGEGISKKLGVSRTAIWKQINQLRAQGYKIDSVSRRGYRLIKKAVGINAEEVYLGLGTELLGQEIRVFPSLGSTNEQVKELAREGAGEGVVVIAEEQTSGKGRRGRKWHAPPGTGLWFSLLVKPQLQPNQAPFLTIIAALAVYQAIEQLLPGGDLIIKWPNDLLLGGKKICGILSELNADMGGINYAVIGIGVNVNQTDFPDELVEIATSLQRYFNQPVDRTVLLQVILKWLEEYYRRLVAGDWAGILAAWKEHLAIEGKKVQIISGEQTYWGRVIELSSQGELVIKDEQGVIHTFWSGDVSLRNSENGNN